MKTVAEIDQELKALDASMKRLEEQREALKNELRVQEARRNFLLAQRELAEMPVAKREALVLAAAGIESAEAVGKPG